MGKVYFEEDDNVYVEGRPETKEFLMQYIWIYPDGKCLFQGTRCEPLAEARRLGYDTPEGEEALARFDEWSSPFNSSNKENLNNIAPPGVASLYFGGLGIGMSGLMTREDRRLFFEANRNLLQKVVDEGYDTEAGKAAFDNIHSHSNQFCPSCPTGYVWYERFPGEHRCGLSQEDIIGFCGNGNIKLFPEEAESILGFLDDQIEPPESAYIPGVFTPVPFVERVGLNADKTRIFVQLPGPVYDTDSSNSSRCGDMLLKEYDSYAPRQFLSRLLPNVGVGFKAWTYEKPPRLLDPSGRVEGLSFDDLDQEWCRPCMPIFRSTDHIADQAAGMLRCFNGSPVLDGFIREFPREAFPDFPDVPHDRRVPDGAFVPDKNCVFWRTDECLDVMQSLKEHLGNYAPKGLILGELPVDPWRDPFARMVETATAFYVNTRGGFKAMDFLYDQVASGSHPAFRSSAAGKDGKVTVSVPKVGWAGGGDMIPLARFYAAGQCAALDPDRGKDGRRDFIIQESPAAAHADEKVELPSIGRLEGIGSKETSLLTVPVNFVSVRSSGRRRSISAPSPDPVDYVARFCLAARAGCDLSTTQEVMDGVRRKLSGWLGRHFSDGDYRRLIDFNRKVERRGKEIVAGMREERDARRKDRKQEPPAAEPAPARDDGGYESR